MVKWFIPRLIVWILPLSLAAQGQISISHSCLFNGFDSTDVFQTTPPSAIVERLTLEICAVVDAKPNFELYASPVRNVLAAVNDNTRTILYDPQFMDGLGSDSIQYWTAYLVLAHAIGHHLFNHNLNEPDHIRRKIMELQADAFAGSTLRLLGAPLEESISNIRISNSKPTPNLDPNHSGWGSGALGGSSWGLGSTNATVLYESFTHPAGRVRLNTIVDAWKKQDEELKSARGELTDIDQDGVPDAIDQCPTTFGALSAAGCPDSDRDGVPDHLDRCPKLFGTSDNKGCPGLKPESKERDADADGTLDDFDWCPQEKGPKEYHGCAMKPFSWPPPPCAERYVLELNTQGQLKTVGEVNNLICKALDSRGYWSRSYYSLPRGCAIVTRLEQYNEDGTIRDDSFRWVDQIDMNVENLIDYISNLFLPRKGRFRLFVFAITNETPTGANEKPLNRDEAKKLLESGAPRLSQSARAQPLEGGHFVEVLVYEFEANDSNLKSTIRCPSVAPCRVHLEKAGLLEHLK